MGRSLNSYRRLFEIGEGGTAKISLAFTEGLAGVKKLVVLKSLLGAYGDEAKEDFVREARLSARLDHPNIVQVHEVIDEAGAPVIVMEYLKGQSLAALAKLGREFPLHFHLRVIADCLRALEYAHSFRDFDGTPLQVVHRDVSPQNVFVTYEGQCKLLDFGIARVGGTSNTQTGVVKGKLRYMSPEQIFGDPLTPISDLYSVGVMLWEAVYGRSMWQKGMSEATIMHRIVNGELPSAEPRSEASLELCALVEQALELEPMGRPQSAAEFRSKLLALAPKSEEGEDVSVFVARMFDRERDSATEKIRGLLADTTLGQDTEAWADTTSHAHLATEKKGVRTGLLWAVLGAVLILFAFLSQTPRPVTLTKLSQSAEPEREQESPEPDRVVDPDDVDPDEGVDEIDLSITVFPEDAEMRLDGARLTSNPFQARVLADERPRELRVEAPGYQGTIRELVFDEDLSLVVRLTRNTARAPMSGMSMNIQQGPPAASMRPTRSRCDPPFHFNDRGVKIFHPECF